MQSTSLNVPRDQKLFELTAAVTRNAIAYVQHSSSQGVRLRRYDHWPTLEWHEGVPDFSFVRGDPPLDYKEVFNPLYGIFGRPRDKETYELNKDPQFGELLAYVRSVPALANYLHLSNRTDSSSDVPLRLFIEYGIDRYIHSTGSFGFDPEKFLPVYLPLEASLILHELAIEIVVLIVLTTFEADEHELAEHVYLSRLSESVQLARVDSAYETREADELVLQQATHGIVLKHYTLSNQARYHRYELETFPIDLIDAFFASLRIFTSAHTGYAQIVMVPIDWARMYKATLLPLECVVVRKYGRDAKPIATVFGEQLPTITTAQLAIVRDLFQAIAGILQSGSEESKRLRLAVKRLNSCFLREDEEDVILDATIGLELLLSDWQAQEVTHKLALRLAAISQLVPGYEGNARQIFDSMKRVVYPFRSAVVHGRKNSTSGGSEMAKPVAIAIDYLGLALRALALNPKYLKPASIDEFLLLS